MDLSQCLLQNRLVKIYLQNSIFEVFGMSRNTILQIKFEHRSFTKSDFLNYLFCKITH